MTDVAVSTRWIDSGGVFGYYDNIIALDNAAEFLGLNDISGVGWVL
jgi:hypothetical protein